MKIKILPVVAFFVLVAGMMISPAAVERVWAEETTTSEDGNWLYIEDGNGGITVVGYRGNETELTDWGTIDGKTVTGIGDEAFSYEISLNSISIPNSVINIGEYAFSCCSINSISIPNSVISIEKGAFTACSSLSSVNMQNGIKYIGDEAFDRCESLTSITIPGSVINIGEGAFSSCSSLSSINIQNGVTYIGNFAFEGCGSLTSITIPSSVTSIGDSPFSGCDKLEKVTVDGNNSNYESDDIGIYNKGKTILLCCLPSKKDVSVPFGVVSIGKNAFANCEGLDSVSLPDSVTSIGEAAFGASTLSSINIPNSVTSIGKAAFYCTNLTNISIPSSVTSIGENVFLYTHIQDIYYGGSKEQWEQAAGNYDKNSYDSVNKYYGIGDSVTIHYNFATSETPETPETPQNPTQTITAKDITKTYGAKAFSLNAKVNTGAKLTYSVSNKKVATVDKKGKVTIKGCGVTNITITAAATGDYAKAAKTIKLTVKPKKAAISSVKSTKKKTAEVKWKRNKEASGYIIQCATDSKFKKNKVQTTVSKNKTISKTVKKLKSGKKYYVRVCAYAKSGKTKVQGDWSKVKKVKVKK